MKQYQCFVTLHWSVVISAGKTSTMALLSEKLPNPALGRVDKNHDFFQIKII